MGRTDDARVVEFLADTVELWGVKATVKPGNAPAVAVVCVDDAVVAWVDRASGTDRTFRWLVRLPVDSLSERATARLRPCTSLVGLLNALRLVLNVDRGSPVRVAAPHSGRT